MGFPVQPPNNYSPPNHSLGVPFWPLAGPLVIRPGGAKEGYRSERLEFRFFRGRHGADAEAISADIGREG